MVEYVKQNFDTFEKQPFFEVDALVFAWLSYVHFPKVDGIEDFCGVKIYETFRAECFDTMFHGLHSQESTLELLTAAVASPRYRNTRLLCYREMSDSENTTQFAAITFMLNEKEYYVAFRGTDKSFIGWKEDFNMSLDVPIQSQVMALSYLAEVAEHVPEGLTILPKWCIVQLP